MAKQIPLTQGKFAIVDDEDYEWLSQWKWCYSNGGYAKRRTRDGTTMFMHHALMGRMSGYQTDHINGDRLDNRRSNLRFATAAQNTRNQRPRVGTSSQYKGVYWQNEMCCWMAQIHVSGKVIRLGKFTDEQEAARAYDTKACELFGDFARTNFQDPNS